MSDADIADAIDAFARAAADARRLGFDAVELHGAHGYLIDQFFWAGTNRARRPVRRARAAAARPLRCRDPESDPRGCRPRLPDHPPRFRNGSSRTSTSSWPTPQRRWRPGCTPLVEAGADVFHCSQRRFWEPEFEGSDLNFAGWAKKLTGKPIDHGGLCRAHRRLHRRLQRRGLQASLARRACSAGSSAATSTWSRSAARCCRTRNGP